MCVTASNRELGALLGCDLTERETDIAHRLLAGGTSKEIGREVGISPRTVEGYRARLMRKLGVANQRQLVARLARVIRTGSEWPAESPVP
jgi:DNA-binding CsgD family transcriptional regulator